MTSNTSHPPLTPLPILDAFLPGSSAIFGFLSQHFKVDVTYYISIFLVCAAALAALKYVGTMLWDLIGKYCMSNVEIHQEDEMYSYVMSWVSQQSFVRRIPFLIAGVRTESQWFWWSGDSNDDGEDIMSDFEIPVDFAGDFEDYWASITKKDKYRRVRYTPYHGSHIFRYKHRLLLFTRTKVEHYSPYNSTQSERISISCLGRNSGILKELLEEAQLAYLNRDGDKTVIYRAIRGDGAELSWRRCLSRTCRPLSTVVLDDSQKQSIVNDVKEYLNPLTRLWYSNRGIPYRRGYLFHGPPGTGKTSLCFSLAGLFHLKIYAVSLNSRALTEEGLAALFQDLPLRCIVLMEDIDAAGLTKKRSSDEGKVKEDESDDASKKKDKDDEPTQKVSLAGVLNIIDGVASSEGRILVMTTNHIEKLDKALIRPGRVDMIVGIGLASTEGVRGMFTTIYTRLEEDLPAGFHAAASARDTKVNGSNANGAIKQPASTVSILPMQTPQRRNLTFSHNYTNKEVTRLADRFAEIIPANEFSPAEVQGYLLKHKYDPQKAIEGAGAWVEDIREERRKAKEDKEISSSKKNEKKGNTEPKGKDDKKNNGKGGEDVEPEVIVEEPNGAKEEKSPEAKNEEPTKQVNGVRKKMKSQGKDEETATMVNGVKEELRPDVEREDTAKQVNGIGKGMNSKVTEETATMVNGVKENLGPELETEETTKQVNGVKEDMNHEEMNGETAMMVNGVHEEI
ncbi:MAG: hypothetical protein M1816_005614 [Peltula sp. TS41687]|nr:MAG: hypothetical protein M1816_005614 [Peltula sp. TS41687]